jgi:polyphenol oxidase
MIIKDTPELLAFFTDISDENIAYHVTNDFAQVNFAREKLSQKYHFKLSNLTYMEQIHSNYVKIADPSQQFQCDALITDKKEIPLMVMVADCVPILFYDLVTKVIAVAHAGRIGTFKNIASNTIDKMNQTYDCNPKNIQVVLGPSIQKCCYEVSMEIAEYTKKSFGDQFVNDRNIDLQWINKKQLLEKGVLPHHIFISEVCTKCGGQPYFSYRKDKTCGRFAGVILLK